MLLGCIGDDFTGSSDLANTLAKQGMRTMQYSGVPTKDANVEVEAGVVSLKSRSIPADEAVRQSLDALRWLKKQGCKQFFYKYCSTFDSTSDGNIGPVADALADALDTDCVIFCPAFPSAGRTIYQGHLFVDDHLLSESGMENHPLTPMTDSDIRRWLQQQSKSSVGYVGFVDVQAGVDAVRSVMEVERMSDKRFIVIDAIRNEDLMTIGRAAAELPLVTGGSGIALGLPDNFRQQDLMVKGAIRWKGESGHCAVLSGSCSKATRAQVALHSKSNPAFEISVSNIIEGKTTALSVAEWLLGQGGVPMAYTSTDPESVALVQEKFGRDVSANVVENLFAEVAVLLVERGVSRLIVAGGETAGAVVEELEIDTMEVGPEIDPGVPAMRASDNLVISLKSGNFGAEDFFAKAAKKLSRDFTVSIS